MTHRDELDPRDIAAAVELADTAPPLTAEARNILLVLYVEPNSRATAA